MLYRIAAARADKLQDSEQSNLIKATRIVAPHVEGGLREFGQVALKYMVNTLLGCLKARIQIVALVEYLLKRFWPSFQLCAKDQADSRQRLLQQAVLYIRSKCPSMYAS